MGDAAATSVELRCWLSQPSCWPVDWRAVIKV